MPERTMSAETELTPANITDNKTDNVEIEALPVSIDRDRAASVIRSLSGDFSVEVQKVIYYPYLWVFFIYSVKTIIGKRRDVKASCFVDLINNQASTTDKFTLETESVSSDNILSPDVGEEEAFKTASTYLTHSAIHKMKALLVPDYEVVEKKIVYKPFWIVKCRNRKRENFKAIVDACTGKFQVL